MQLTNNNIIDFHLINHYHFDVYSLLPERHCRLVEYGYVPVVHHWSIDDSLPFYPAGDEWS